MGLMSKSFFRRRQQKNKKKLSDSLASLDSLQTQVDETLNYEDRLQIERDETQKRLQKASDAKKDLLERIKEKTAKLARVTDKINQATAVMTKLREKNSQNEEVCRHLELLHKELPTRMWTLQVQLSRAFRSIEETKRNISSAFTKHNSCREKLENKREELLRKQIQIKSTKEKIARMKLKLQKMYDTKKVKEFQQKSLESMIIYVMNMNLRAVNSRSKMIERRGHHLEKMLENMNSELGKYTLRLNDMKKVSSKEISDDIKTKRRQSFPQRTYKRLNISVEFGDL